MPFPTADDFERNTDQKLLIMYVDGVEELFRDIREAPVDKDGNLMFIEELINPMMAALEVIWSYFDQMRNRIRRLTEFEVFQHGLSGPQLHYKLLSVRHYKDLYDQVKNAKNLKKLLNIIKSLWQSLLEFKGIGWAVKEILDITKDITSSPEPEAA